MQYNDGLYGAVEVSEPVLVDLMTSDTVQRTKGISQHGITALLGITPPFSRFNHCVGAMLLDRQLGADLDEQACGFSMTSATRPSAMSSTSCSMTTVGSANTRTTKRRSWPTPTSPQF